jgi:hypothetical protein
MTYTTKRDQCTNVDFALTNQLVATGTNEYATEHIYEIQMVKQFLTYMWENDDAIKKWRQQPANTAAQECDIWNGFMWQDGANKGWWDDGMPLSDPSPIGYILEELSGGQHVNEMVYLEEKMNSIKGVMFGDKQKWDLTLWEQQLAMAARMASIIFYLQTTAVKTIYKDVSKRMYTAWGKFDVEAQSDAPANELKQVKFQEGYIKRETKFIKGMETSWKKQTARQAKEAEDKIRKASVKSQMDLKIADNIALQRTTPAGKFNEANMSFATELLAWYTGTRP